MFVLYYFFQTFISFLLIVNCLKAASGNHDDTTSISIVTYKDSDGNEIEEHAFEPPMSGIPDKMIQLYCANVKLRLYWGGYREQAKDTARKGLYLRRMARLAKHLFKEIRDVDDPFDAPRLSTVDEYFEAKTSDTNEREDTRLERSHSNLAAQLKASFKPLNKIKKLLKSRQSNDELPEISVDLETENQSDVAKKVWSYLTPKNIALGIYTRYSTMWWLMMPCLYAKYYLWDPALDEYIKLQKSLLMFPELLTTKLQDIDCKPVKFFKRILDVCKILNPFLNMNFGLLSLDRMSRFKVDSRAD